MPPLDTLITRLGFIFNDIGLLEGALTHRSYANEHLDRTHHLANSERLEFLGDSVLNYIAAELVFRRYPERDEGQLTALRAELIKTPTLATLARALDLGRYLWLSKGEDHSGARDRDALLADTFEALLAAIYLDAGLHAARSFVTPLLEQQLAQIEAQGRRVDYKTQLQERIQSERNITPLYSTLSVSGPDHRREFVIAVLAGDDQLGVGRGPSKQAATLDAARAALEGLGTKGTEELRN